MSALTERSERSERSTHTVRVTGGADALIRRAAEAGVRLEARPAGRLWADRPGLLPSDLRAELAVHRPAVLHALTQTNAERVALPSAMPASRARNAPKSLPGVLPAWCDGVALLVTMPAPDAITAERWAILAGTSRRLLHDHGAVLHRANWDALDIFGLHARAPLHNPAGWGLAWLLGADGEVLDIGPNTVGLRRQPDGARLAFYKKQAPAWAGIILAWNLPGVSA